MTFDIPLKSSLSPAEAAEIIEMTETAANEVQHQQIPKRKKRKFESYLFFCNYGQKGKRSTQMWGTIMIKTFGDQENRTNGYGIKGTSVFINMHICTSPFPPPQPREGFNSDSWNEAGLASFHVLHFPVVYLKKKTVKRSQSRGQLPCQLPCKIPF